MRLAYVVETSSMSLDLDMVILRGNLHNNSIVQIAVDTF